MEGKELLSIAGLLAMDRAVPLQDARKRLRAHRIARELALDNA
jgi:hypothetical protein